MGDVEPGGQVDVAEVVGNAMDENEQYDRETEHRVLGCSIIVAAAAAAPPAARRARGGGRRRRRGGELLCGHFFGY